MKTINAEGIVWGLLPEEKKQQIRQAREDGHKIYCHVLSWIRTHIEKEERVFHSHIAYKAEIPETKKVPWERDDYIKNSCILITNKEQNYYTAIMQINDKGLYVSGIGKASYEFIAKYYNKFDGTELYKEVES